MQTYEIPYVGVLSVVVYHPFIARIVSGYRMALYSRDNQQHPLATNAAKSNLLLPKEGVKMVHRLSLKTPDDQINLMQELPPHHSLLVGFERNTYCAVFRTVKMKNPEESVRWLSGLYHEIKHAYDHERDSIKVDLCRAALKPEDGDSYDDLRRFMKMEYDAWEFALAEFADIRAPSSVMQEVQQNAYDGLETYIKRVLYPTEGKSILEVHAELSDLPFDELITDFTQTYNHWREQHLPLVEIAQ